MALKLRVISDHYRALGHRRSHVFGAAGGSIGRAPDNEWVLPDRDRYVSSHHCRISFRAGAFVLEDTSTNGVFVNGADTPVCLTGTHALKDGDRLRMGDYEILVSLHADEAPKEVAPPRASATEFAAQRHVTVEEDLGESLDLRSLLSTDGDSDLPHVNAYGIDIVPTSATTIAPEKKPALPAESRREPIVEPPPPPLAPEVLPSDDWRMSTRRIDLRSIESIARSMKSREESVRDTTNAADQTGGGVEAFCRGAGIDPGALTIEARTRLLTQAGQMLREAVVGLMEALQAQPESQAGDRPGPTNIRTAQDNPLRWSASVDEALRSMLDTRSGHPLGPADALRDAFAELRNQRTAYAEAVQVALSEFLSQLDPKQLEGRFDRGLKRGSLPGASHKNRYWDLYQEFYRLLTQAGGDALPAAFSEALARAYEAKLSDSHRRKRSASR